MSTVRQPAVAGAFYPAQAGRLADMLRDMLPAAGPKRAVLGLMAPHAGYVYSGSAAGRTYGAVEIPKRVLLLGPNHTGRGDALAAAVEDQWLTPLGKATIDRALLDEIANEDPEVVFDGRAHGSEHSLEVQLPFLQTLRPDIAVAPLVIGTLDLAELVRLGHAIAAVIARMPERPLIVISSDMTHYEPAASARVKDARALDRLAAIDPEGLHRVVLGEGITMCGIAPATAALVALRDLGATRGEQVIYTHSGVVTGDDSDVVAYAGMVFVA